MMSLCQFLISDAVPEINDPFSGLKVSAHYFRWEAGILLLDIVYSVETSNSKNISKLHKSFENYLTLLNVLDKTDTTV